MFALVSNPCLSIPGDAAGMTDDQIKNFVGDLGKLGFCWVYLVRMLLLTIKDVYHAWWIPQ